MDTHEATVLKLSPVVRRALRSSVGVELSADIASNDGYGGDGVEQYFARFYATWVHSVPIDVTDQRILRELADVAEAEPVSEGQRIPFGSAIFTLVDLYDGAACLELNRLGGEVGYLAARVLTPTGQPPQELADRLEVIGSHAILVALCSTRRSWRGARFGLTAVGTAIAELGRGCMFAAALDGRLANELRGPDRIPGSSTAAAWSMLGFAEWREHVLILDLATTALERSRKSLADTG